MTKLAPNPATDASAATLKNTGSPAVYQIVLDSASPTHWHGWLGAELLATGKSVEFAVCRVLAERGCAGVIETWHRGAKHPSMRIDISAGAKLAVSETELHGPRFSAWRPFSPDMRLPVNRSDEDGCPSALGMHPSQNSEPPSTP